MNTVARLGATAIAVVALVAGCSSATDGDAGNEGQGGGQSPAPAAPAASRPLSDFADGSNYSFGTPSGQIQCRVVDGTLACQTEGRLLAVADSALCGFYPGEEQGRTNRFGYLEGTPQPCATIIQGEGFDSPHTLAYGQGVTAELSSGRSVTCTSALDGLTCTQTGGTGPRGFFLSIDSFTVF